MMTRTSTVLGGGVLLTCVTATIFISRVPSVGGAEADSRTSAPTNAVAAPGVPPLNIGVARPAVWTVLPASNGEYSCSFAVEIAGFSAAATPDGYALHIPGEAAAAGRGTPAVPRVARFFPGVSGRVAVLQVSGVSPAELTNLSVAAAEDYVVVSPDGGTRHLAPVRHPSPAIYATDQFWPPELGRVEEAWMGTQKLVRVECFPVQYNPASKIVRWYRRMEGTLVFEPAESGASR